MWRHGGWKLNFERLNIHISSKLAIEWNFYITWRNIRRRRTFLLWSNSSIKHSMSFCLSVCVTVCLPVCRSYFFGQYPKSVSFKFMKFAEKIHIVRRSILLSRWPSVGRKAASISGFRPLSRKLITQSTSHVVYALVRWVFKTDFVIGHVGRISSF